MIRRSLAALTPLAAFGIAVLALAAAVSIGWMAPPSRAPGVTAAAAGIFHLGWPCLVVRELTSLGRVSPAYLRFSALAFVAAESCILLLIFAPSSSTIGAFLNVAGLAAATTVFYLATRAFVEAEGRESSSAGRPFGTFVLFWFLPLGIWSFQRRLRSIAWDPARRGASR
jgi:hypothetical protein